MSSLRIIGLWKILLSPLVPRGSSEVKNWMRLGRKFVDLVEQLRSPTDMQDGQSTLCVIRLEATLSKKAWFYVNFVYIPIFFQFPSRGRHFRSLYDDSMAFCCWFIPVKNMKKCADKHIVKREDMLFVSSWYALEQWRQISSGLKKFNTWYIRVLIRIECSLINTLQHKEWSVDKNWTRTHQLSYQLEIMDEIVLDFYIQIMTTYSGGTIYLYFSLLHKT